VPERGFARVEDDSNVIGKFLREDTIQKRDESIDSTRVLTFRIHQRLAYKCEIGTVRECHCIDEINSLNFCHESVCLFYSCVTHHYVENIRNRGLKTKKVSGTLY